MLDLAGSTRPSSHSSWLWMETPLVRNTWVCMAKRTPASSGLLGCYQASRSGGGWDQTITIIIRSPSGSRELMETNPPLQPSNNSLGQTRYSCVVCRHFALILCWPMKMVLHFCKSFRIPFSYNIYENWHSGSKNLAGTAKKNTHTTQPTKHNARTWGCATTTSKCFRDCPEASQKITVSQG